MAKITRVEQAVPIIKTKKKVAAYARISMESERMNHSLSAQISYYSSLIQKNPDWQYAEFVVIMAKSIPTFNGFYDADCYMSFFGARSRCFRFL